MQKLLFKIYSIIIIATAFSPAASFAQVGVVACSKTGYTIETINGIFTKDEGPDGAIANKNSLKRHMVITTYNGEPITFDYLYNPTHGLLDLSDVAIQKTFEGVDMRDPDFINILNDASAQVKTQKVLLVAHSQGNFYANNLHETIAKSGDLPVQSIGVYGVATPASYVAGNGIYRTSATDTVINRARMVFPGTILPAYDSIDYLASDDSGRGHGFREIYLEYRSEEIKKEIEESLGKLSTDSARSEDTLCINPPKELSAYEKITGVVAYPINFALAATSIGLTVTKGVIVASVNFQQTAGTALGNGIVASVGFLQKAGFAFGNGLVWVGTAVANTAKEAGNSFLALVYSVPVPPASSLIAGALPLVPAQTPPPSAAPATPAQTTPPSIVAPAPQIATKAITAPSAGTAVSETTLTSSPEAISATTISTPETIATSTAEVIAVVLPPVSQGGGSVTGVSADDLLKQALAAEALAAAVAQSQNTGTSTQDMATSTEDIATSTEPEIVYRDPVVINEIAWMGTSAQANDEWIELYNKTGRDIDLTGWTLESKNQRPLIELSGIIPARGYFLLERTASTTTDQPEDMVYTGALNNSGIDANLYLKQGTTTVDYVDFGYWPFGDNPSASSGQVRKTMERVSPYAEGNNYYNWKTYSETLAAPTAKDVDGNDIFGTPGKKNSVAGFYTPAPGGIAADTTWYAKRSPYYIPVPMSIRTGATLTIEPGTVVKIDTIVMQYEGELLVEGVLKAEGTRDNPIVFTSFRDDGADGIDSNQDATSTSPAAGDWRSITFLNPVEPSIVRFANIRYGGGMAYPNGYPVSMGAVNIRNASPIISDSVIDAGKEISVYVKGDSHPIIARNAIRNTIGSRGYGILLADASSTADIIGTTFGNNGTAIISESVSDTPLVVRDNIFTNNIKNGEFNGYMNFNLDNTNNQDTERKGGFYISLYVREGRQKTLRADTMPYIVRGGIMVEAGSALTIEPGAVLKSAPNPQAPPVPVIVRGTLKAHGTAEKPIIFTAFADDSDGYDSNRTDRQPVPGDWENIQFIGASSSESVLEYTVIKYGGSGQNLCPYAYFGGPCMEYKGAVLIDSASPGISQTTFDRNQAVSIYIQGNAQSTIKDSRISNTMPGTTGPYRDAVAGYGISVGAESAPTLEGNTYSGNVRDVVYR